MDKPRVIKISDSWYLSNIDSFTFHLVTLTFVLLQTCMSFLFHICNLTSISIFLVVSFNFIWMQIHIRSYMSTSLLVNFWTLPPPPFFALMRYESKKKVYPSFVGFAAVSNYKNISIYLKRSVSNDTGTEYAWWEIKVVTGHASKFITFLTFNDRVAPAGFSFITGYG